MSDFRSQPTISDVRQHTPTPWYHRQAGETNQRGEPLDWIADHPEKGRHRKIIVGRDACYSLADYAFIVEVVNSHASLQAQVKAGAERIEELEKMAREIANSTGPRPEGFREPDDADWRAYALEFQRLAKLRLQPIPGEVGR